MQESRVKRQEARGNIRIKNSLKNSIKNSIRWKRQEARGNSQQATGNRNLEWGC